MYFNKKIAHICLLKQCNWKSCCLFMSCRLLPLLLLLLPLAIAPCCLPWMLLGCPTSFLLFFPPSLFLIRTVYWHLAAVTATVVSVGPTDRPTFWQALIRSKWGEEKHVRATTRNSNNIHGVQQWEHRHDTKGFFFRHWNLTSELAVNTCWCPILAFI
jgi:hypothetical protein